MSFSTEIEILESQSEKKARSLTYRLLHAMEQRNTLGIIHCGRNSWNDIALYGFKSRKCIILGNLSVGKHSSCNPPHRVHPIDYAQISCFVRHCERTEAKTKWTSLSRRHKNCCVLTKISLKFVLQDSSNNKPTLVQIMAWCRPGDKPLSEPMLVRLSLQLCITWPQWVKVRNRWISPRAPSQYKDRLIYVWRFPC